MQILPQLCHCLDTPSIHQFLYPHSCTLLHYLLLCLHKLLQIRFFPKIQFNCSLLAWLTFSPSYQSDSQIRMQKSQFGTPLFSIFSSLSHFFVKPVPLYYAKIKSSKSKSAHIFWIGWLINEKSGCPCLRNSVLIYESPRYVIIEKHNLIPGFFSPQFGSKLKVFDLSFL